MEKINNFIKMLKSSRFFIKKKSVIVFSINITKYLFNNILYFKVFVFFFSNIEKNIIHELQFKQKMYISIRG